MFPLCARPALSVRSAQAVLEEARICVAKEVSQVLFAIHLREWRAASVEAAVCEIIEAKLAIRAQHN